MQLHAYLKETKTLITEFADEINVSRATVWSWMAGKSYPCMRNIIKIERVTHGRVTFSDMVELYLMVNRDRGSKDVVEDVPSAW